MPQLSRPQQRILSACQHQLHLLPECHTEFSPDPKAQPCLGALTIGGPWGQACYRVQVLPRLTPQLAQLVPYQLQSLADDGPPPLLLTDYVPSHTGEQWQQQGLEYMDALGNAYLQQPPLFLERQGRRPQKPDPGLGRVTQRTGLQLLLALLQDPSLAASNYRELARQSGIALGAVGPILKELQQLGYLEGQRQQRRLHHIRELLYQWLPAAEQRLYPWACSHRCRPENPKDIIQLPEKLQETQLEDQVLLSGELATSLLTDGPAPRSAGLIVPARQGLNIMLRLRFLPDEAGPIHIVERFGAPPLLQGPDFLEWQVAHPVWLLLETLEAHAGSERDMPQQLAQQLEEMWLQGLPLPA